MKYSQTLALPIAFTVVSLVLAGCNKSEPSAVSPVKPNPIPAAHAVSAEKTSFNEVTAHLDPGGSLYVYLSTEQLLHGLTDRISGLHKLLNSVPSLEPDARENIDKGLTILSGLVKSSGVEDVSGFGASSIARETGLYHSKFLLHHYAGQGSGFLWSMFGQKPHPLTAVNLLPESTVLAYFGDLDLPLLWSVVRKQVSTAGLPQADAVLGKIPEAFEQATSLKWDQVLASLGGEYGFVLMLDDARKISLPLPNAPLEIPEPSLMLVVKTRDDTIFNRLDQLMKQSGQQVESVDKPNLKMRTLPLPLPLPIQLRPTIASSDGYLLIANTDTVIQQALALKAGQGKGLKSTPEFQRLTKDLPQVGNQFSFVSQRLGATILRVQQQALGSLGGDAQKAGSEWLQTFLGTNAAGYSCAVSGNTDEGWLAVMNGNQHPAKVMLAASVVPAAMLSAIAIPNFVKARNTAQQHACANNLRQIDAAKQLWALEKKKAETETPATSDIAEYLHDKKLPACPAGGTYSINPVSQHAECSVQNHKLGE